MALALEGSQAMARAVALCRPQVVAAYPITPQTHIVEGIAKLVADGRLDCEMVSVESEHSAATVALGAALAGSRAYTASSSQGILLMSEVIFNIAGLRVPLVMTCANRALGAPLSIWNDQQDSMAVRDAGWIQIYCATNQEAVDTTIQAFRIAERCELPVMVCVDGFTLTHTLEGLEMPTQEQVDTYLPAYRYARALDPAAPISVGMLVTPEHFSEVRHAHHQAVLRALPEIEAADADYAALTGRAAGGLLEVRGDASARIGILAIGSVLGTLEDAMLSQPDLPRTRLIKLRSFRPFPAEALRRACEGLDHLIILERAISPGAGAILGPEVVMALVDGGTLPKVHDVAAGLGGRDMRIDLYRRLLALTESDPKPFHVIDARLEQLPEEDR
ncbi:MAG: pyruvate ferredoxin oxidoreductase [Chromatiales bacterium]|jgi:pyruvate ferredoxin oxidoreductase alpha subunit|nr:pyruvate ferredoxin oxidoreductase [Chromatiales bacterium]MDX9766461.1 pyruvate ferredoxin oxidoreductase [Ectothiorhodospiraceae bacterium]